MSDAQRLVAAIERALTAARCALSASPAPGVRGPLAQLLGAIYALQRASALGFTDEIGERNLDLDAAWDELESIEAALRAGGGYHPHGLWSHFLAGFYFNDAVSRLARVDEILHVSGRTPSAAMRAVRDRDNYLKHANHIEGVMHVSVADVCQALEEICAWLERVR